MIKSLVQLNFNVSKLTKTSTGNEYVDIQLFVQVNVKIIISRMLVSKLQMKSMNCGQNFDHFFCI